MARAKASNPEKQMEQAIMALATENPQGLTQSMLNSETGHFANFPLQEFTLQYRVQVLNKMLGENKLSLFAKPDGSVLFKLAQPSDAKLKNLSAEEALVYQVIKSAGNTGVWTKDIKMRTNLAQPQITKIIKTLEGRNLIKSVKNVNNPSKKLYMLFELEPSTEITGGAWYSHQQLDLEFITQLTQACYTLISRQQMPSLSAITNTINSTGLTRVHLAEEDIRKVINTLIADGRVEAMEDDDGVDRYRPAVLSVPTSTAFTTIPCGVCPVIDQCQEGGQISPQTCVYYQKWLEF